MAETADDEPPLLKTGTMHRIESDGSDGDEEAGPEYRNVGILSLLVISFFWASGGIYGNEVMIYYAPPAIVFLGLLLTPLVYAIPVALMTAEMATAMPRDGGLVAWVTEACGTTIGGHNNYWQWISYIFDASVYPVLAGGYVSSEVDFEKIFGSVERGITVIALAIVVLVTSLKLLGTSLLVRFSAVLLALSVAPSLIYMIWGLAYLEPHTWISTDDSEIETDYAVLVSWLLWLYSGFFSLGSLAGEVEKPSYTFPRVVAILVPCVILFNVTPLAISTSLDSDRNNYEAGHFTTLASQIAGDWLGYGFIMASNVCLIGLYNAQTMTCERSTSCFVDSVMGDRMITLQRSPTRIVRYLFYKGETGVAPIFIIGNACISAVLVWFPYEFLVQFNMLQMSFVSILFFYSYIYFRFKRPTMPRPFKIPGPLWFVVFVTLLPLGCTLTNIYFALSDTEAESDNPFVEDPYFKIFMFEAFVLAGIITNVIYNYRKNIADFWGRCRHGNTYTSTAYSPLPSSPTDTSDFGDLALYSRARNSEGNGNGNGYSNGGGYSNGNGNGNGQSSGYLNGKVNTRSSYGSAGAGAGGAGAGAGGEGESEV